MANLYKIALINYVFDNSYENVLRFDTDVLRDAYFASLVENWTSLVNFNVGDLQVTQQTVTYSEADDIVQLLSKNYAIIKNFTSGKSLYYFIRRSTQGSGKTIILDLELDIYQTYYNSLTFADTIIQRAHLPRFVPVPGDTTRVMFNGAPDSPLFEGEALKNLSKRLTGRRHINWYINDNQEGLQDAINLWLSQNVRCWVYVFKIAAPFEVFKKDNTTKISIDPQFRQYFSDEGLENCQVRLPYQVFCYPLMNGYNKMYAKTNANNTYELSGSLGYDALEYLNENLDGFLLTRKYSTIPPFRPGDYNTITLTRYNFEIVNNDLYINVYEGQNNPSADFFDPSFSTVYSAGGHGFISVSMQPIEYGQKSNLDGLGIFEFSKATIIGAARNKMFNPKLLSADYKTIRLTNDTSFFEYDLQKLNNGNIDIVYSEPLTPDITRQYLRYKGKNDTIYLPQTAQNFTGLTASFDSTAPLGKDQYKIFIASNKNFFLQRTTNEAYNATKAGIAATGQIFSGEISKGFGTLANAAADFAVSRMQSNLTLDNMKAAPDQIINANGSGPLLAGVNGANLYCETYDALPHEVAAADDYMYKFGYSYGRIGNIKQFDNNRKYFDFVQADVDIITGGEISENVHDQFKRIFMNGVRFWHTAAPQYTLENYEKSLEV